MEGWELGSVRSLKMLFLRIYAEGTAFFVDFINLLDKHLIPD
jgi:hypothetical protein